MGNTRVPASIVALSRWLNGVAPSVSDPRSARQPHPPHPHIRTGCTTCNQMHSSATQSCHHPTGHTALLSFRLAGTVTPSLPIARQLLLPLPFSPVRVSVCRLIEMGAIGRRESQRGRERRRWKSGKKGKMMVEEGKESGGAAVLRFPISLDSLSSLSLSPSLWLTLFLFSSSLLLSRFSPIIVTPPPLPLPLDSLPLSPSEHSLHYLPGYPPSNGHSLINSIPLPHLFFLLPYLPISIFHPIYSRVRLIDVISALVSGLKGPLPPSSPPSAHPPRS